MSLSPQEMRALYERTEIVRRPTYGIVTGYHELPYVCLGPDHDKGHGTLLVEGKIQVSPRIILRPSHLNPSYEEIFGEDNVDDEISGRMFGFLGFRDRPVECKSEHLKVTHRGEGVEASVNDTLDRLARHEDITTGVIVTPDSRYYPVSIERFIGSILDDEFSA